MTNSDLKATIEALLFIHGEPMSTEKLAKTCGASKNEVVEAIAQLTTDYTDRGFIILEHDNKYQLGTNPRFTDIIEKLIKNEFSEELSRAALETAAIIAYKGPMTRVEIEHIRGVNSSFTLRNLAMRGLIERTENPKDARSYVYQISFDFLKHFGLTKREELPHFEEFQKEKIEIAEEVPHADASANKIAAEETMAGEENAAETPQS